MKPQLCKYKAEIIQYIKLTDTVLVPAAGETSERPPILCRLSTRLQSANPSIAIPRRIPVREGGRAQQKASPTVCHVNPFSAIF